MTRSEIGPRIKEVLARHLNVPYSEVTDNTVIGRMFISDEDLQLALMLRIPVGVMYVNTPTATLGQFIKDTEEQWDMMADWEHKNLATA